MKRKTNLLLTILAIFILGITASAQGGKKKLPREAEKLAAAVTKTGDGAVTLTSLKPGSPELEKAYADKNFLDACAILAASGEMFLAGSAQIARDGEKYAITFDVVIEATKTPGQYRQLVYAFDGKESSAYFNEKNEKYVQPKARSGAASKIKWPPVWWPGSGGGSTGVGGGFEWGDWYQVSIDNCHFNFICPFIHAGKMRQEERVSKANSSIKQTRWILISCGCH